MSQSPESMPPSQSPEEFESDEDRNVRDQAEKLREKLEPLDPLRRLEAALFLAPEPFHSRKLSQLAGLTDGTQARTLAKQLNREYNERGRAYCVTQVAGGFQLRTRPMFRDWLVKIQRRPAPLRLSGPSLETLSVVAYRQPVLKSEIEAIRGVSCGELLRQLLDRGLIRIVGRSPELGNPFLYGTTRKFLEVFGLPNLDSLPRSARLKGKGLPNWTLTHTAQPENSAKTAPNTLDEPDSDSQNDVDPNSSACPNATDDPEEE